MECGLICSVKHQKQSIPLQKIDVGVSIIGFIADVEAKLIYKNDLDNPVEATFVFPLDDECAVYQLIAEIDGRKIVAEIQEKGKARETYEEALEAGQSAALLEEFDETGDVFTCKLGNLPPKGEAILTFSFASELSLDPDGSVRFEMPAVLNPRYSPEGQGLTAQGVKYVCQNKLPYELKFNASVGGGMKVAKIEGGTDKLTTTQDGNFTQVKLAEEFNFDHDITLQIYYEDPHQPGAVFEAGHTDKTGMLAMDCAMLNFSPKVEGTVDPKKKEFIFLIDRSGSMRDRKIMNAREALLLFLKSLPIDCLFNVVGFGGSYEAMFEDGSRVYNEENQRFALDDQSEISADLGGTKILEPLQYIFQKQPEKCVDREIFVITDGEVWNVAEIISVIKKATRTRVFSLGIGEGASTSLVKGIARAGKGKAYFVKDDELVHAKVIDLLKCAMQVSVEDVQLRWDIPSGITANLVPSNIPNLFDGEKLNLYTVFDKPIVKDIRATLTGKVGDSEMKYEITMKKESGYNMKQPIHRLAAKKQIEQLEMKMCNDNTDQITEGDILKKEVVLISQAANVISSETSFIAVDKNSKVEGRISKIFVPRKVPQHSRATVSRSQMSNYDQRSMLMCCPRIDLSARECVVARSRKCIDLSAAAPDYPEHTNNKGLIGSMADQLVSFKVKRAQESRRSMATQSTISAMMGTTCAAPTAGKSQPNAGYMDVVNLQEFRGNWRLTPELAAAVSIKLDDLKSKNVGCDELVWATGIAVAYLRKNYSANKAEWEMIEKKAFDWMKSELKSENCENIIAEAMKML